MSATPEQIAVELEDLAEIVRGELPSHLYVDDLRAAAALIRAQAERVRVLEALLQRLEPSIGWRSAMGTSRDFMCEFCHQTHEHFAHIKHTDDCPVIQVRAALRGEA